ncbi:MAG: hypothetical protein ACFE9I_08255 [Candidatus Hermodarchaeota archaeon]
MYASPCGPSVTLAATILPVFFISLAEWIISSRFKIFFGSSSPVKTKWPASIALHKLLYAGLFAIYFFSSFFSSIFV